MPEFICHKCFTEYLAATNYRLVAGPNDNSYCDCVYSDDVYLQEAAGWSCDRCKGRNNCPMTMHEILYEDNKLPSEIQADIQNTYKYGPKSEAFQDAKKNFEKLQCIISRFSKVCD